VGQGVSTAWSILKPEIGYSRSVFRVQTLEIGARYWRSVGQTALFFQEEIMFVRRCRPFLSVTSLVLTCAGVIPLKIATARASDGVHVSMKIVDSETRENFDQFRKILVSPTVNTPEPFRGFGGFTGWPRVCRLKNGDLFVAFSAGYWHASWPTPFDVPPEETARWDQTKLGWLLKWDAPEGGRIMWIRSHDGGKTWTAPKPFPVIPGVYAPGQVIQLRDGTMITGARIQSHHGYWTRMPTTPLEFSRTAANRFPERTVIFRSDDNGETWREVSRIAGPFASMDHPHSIFEARDGTLLWLVSFSPVPGGKGWPVEEPRWLTALNRSEDKGKTWSTLSVIGDDDFDVDEGTAAYLPDGSLGFPSRPTSAWFQSYDNGRTWAKPFLLHSNASLEQHAKFGSEYSGPKMIRRGQVVVTPDGNTALVFCGGPGGDGQVIYSHDSGKTWVKPAADRGFKFDPISYYPDACVLEDGSIFTVGQHEGLSFINDQASWSSIKNRYGPHGALVSAMRFRIKSPKEGEGIELLPIGGSLER
jgi:hypothetical protein